MRTHTRSHTDGHAHEFGQNAARIATGVPGDARFIAVRLSGLFPRESAHAWFLAFFWGHMVAVLGFLITSPIRSTSTSSRPSQRLFLLPGAEGAIAPVNLADETLTKYGATDIEDLTWKQLLNGFTCTECGRCTSVCPANATGKLLNPKKIMVDIRSRTMEKPLLWLPRPRPGEMHRRSPAGSSSTISSPSRSSGPVPRAWPACRSVRS